MSDKYLAYLITFINHTKLGHGFKFMMRKVWTDGHKTIWRMKRVFTNEKVSFEEGQFYYFMVQRDNYN